MALPAPGAHDDSTLVLAVQAGDRRAFAELFSRHHPDVRNACAHRMACPLEADEIAQAAFVRAFERIDQCRGDRQFGAWVQTIARHMCVDALRARSRVVLSESPIPDHDAQGEQPDGLLLDQENYADFRRALASLPPRQREAVTARAMGSGPQQIADDLGLSVGAVDSLILRGRRRLAASYRRAKGESGSVATLTSGVAAASVVAGVSVGSTRLLGGVAVAAEAGRELVRPVAKGVAAAVMTVGIAFTGATSGPGDAPPVTSNLARESTPTTMTAPNGAGTTPPAPALEAKDVTGTKGVTGSGNGTGASGVAADARPTETGQPSPVGSSRGAESGTSGTGSQSPSVAHGEHESGQSSGTPGTGGASSNLVDPIVEPVTEAVGGATQAAAEPVSETVEVVDDTVGGAVEVVGGLLPG